MIRKCIDVGDIVSVTFPSCPAEEDVEVIYTPSAIGDCWHLRRPDGTLVNVMVFEKMVRTKQEDS